MRSFIAIEIDPDKRMLRAIKEMKSLGTKIKAVEIENIHLTLKFLGEIDERQVESISKDMESLSKYEEFNIQLKGVGAFPSVDRPRVIWVGVVYPETLENIWRDVEEIAYRAGIDRESRGFSPHITIGRLKERSIGRLRTFMEKYSDAEFGAQRVREIKLKKSDLTPSGPIYSDIFSVKLR